MDRHDYIEPGNDYIDLDVVPYISDPKAWDQYGNDVLYDAEVRLRDWLTKMSEDSTFCRKYTARTFRFSQVFQILYGRPYDIKRDGGYATTLSRLFRYYCSKTSKNTADKITGKIKSKTSFTFSVARLSRPAYSLKLRLEMFRKDGIIPTAANMKLPKDISIGECRNPLTEAHRASQREAARKRYNDYQRSYRAQTKAKQNDTDDR